MTPKQSLFGAAALVAAVLAFHAVGFRINLSASMPAGLYRLGPCGQQAQAELGLGDLVVMDTELAARMNPKLRFFRERRYLSFTGSADDLLLKRVVGVGGEQVEERDGVLIVGGRPLSPEASARASQAQGEPLPTPTLPSIIAPGALWLSSEHPRGIDSRYFGPVPREAVVCKAEALWTGDVGPGKPRDSGGVVAVKACRAKSCLIQNVCRNKKGTTFCIMASEATKTEALLRLARKGPVRARDLDDAGIPRAYLRRLCDRGLLEKVDRGLYRLADAPVTELHSLAEVAVRVPHGVICLISALQVHELTTEVPHAVWLMIERHGRMPKLSYPKLEVVRASGPALEHGVETRTIEGVPVRITSVAKTVADCFRYRQHVGLEVAIAALRDYLRKYRGGMSALVEAARADRVYTLMRPYMEALA